MRHQRTFLACLCCIILLAAAQSAEGRTPKTLKWQPFTSEEGRFRVLMPGDPIYKETVYDGQGLKITEHIHIWEKKFLQLSLSYSDLPWIATFLGRSKTIIRKAKEALLEEEGATEIDFHKLKLGRYRGGELEYQADEHKGHEALIGKARFYVVKKRIYVLVATTPIEKPRLKDLDLFLESFELLPKK